MDVYVYVYVLTLMVNLDDVVMGKNAIRYVPSFENQVIWLMGY